MLEAIIARDAPTPLLPTMGGQTGLEAARSTSRKRRARQVQGRDDRRLERGDDRPEDREKFKQAMPGSASPARVEPRAPMDEALRIRPRSASGGDLVRRLRWAGSGGGIV